MATRRVVPSVAAVLATAALLIPTGCGGGGVEATRDTPQGTAMLWLDAAFSRDEAGMKSLSKQGFDARSARVAGEIREHFEAGVTSEDFRWGGSGKEGDVWTWSATGPGGIVFFEVIDAGGGDYRVADVQTSWVT